MKSWRDIEVVSREGMPVVSSGRNAIAVIGIDHYHHWPQLSNAVQDASGAAALFQRLGFELVGPPLLDEGATGRAIQSLVTDDLKKLGPEDSLVIFYAGHGGVQRHHLGDQVIKTGYLIPVDAQDKVVTWIDLEGWLRAVSVLPAKHILVVVDACNSGIALEPIIKWRDSATWQDVPLATLQARRSRRIITSALDDQVALDSGPVHGHSLFTGCLIEGLTHGIRSGAQMTTGSELGLYIQRRVATYPDSRQTPDFGTFAFDERGELVIPLLTGSRLQQDSASKSLLAVDSASSLAEPIVASSAATSGTSRTTARASGVRAAVLGAVGAMLAITVAYATLSEKRLQIDAPRTVSDAPRMVSDAPRTVPGDAARVPSVVPPVGLASGLSERERSEVRALASQPATPKRGRCLERAVFVPAGTFLMGSPDGIGDSDEHPQHEVRLSEFCIDRTEVTVKGYSACVEAGACVAAALTVRWNAYSADQVKLWSRFCNGPDRPDHPINCVDWDQATTYCRWAGGRLPTEAEWEYAARGSDGRKYPWGNEVPSARRVNACGPECVAMAKRDLNQDWNKLYTASDGWETTAPVGSFPSGASPFGALDMAGNVWEWTADWYGPYSGTAVADPRGPKAGITRVDRGGGWGKDVAGDVRVTDRDWTGPSIRNRNIGFRCAYGTEKPAQLE